MTHSLQPKFDELAESIRKTRELIDDHSIFDGVPLGSYALRDLFTRLNAAQNDLLGITRDVLNTRDDARRGDPDAGWYIAVRRFIRSLSELMHDLADDNEFDRESVQKVECMIECVIEGEFEGSERHTRPATVLERDHWLAGRRQLVEELRTAMARSYLANTGVPDSVGKMVDAMVESDPPPIVVPIPDRTEAREVLDAVADQAGRRVDGETVRWINGVLGGRPKVTILANPEEEAEWLHRNSVRVASHQGHAAANLGYDHANCPYMDDSDEQAAWIRGFDLQAGWLDAVARQAGSELREGVARLTRTWW